MAIIYDEEFAELLEEAGKRRKRFVAWHDSERPGRPHARGADRARATRADPVPPARAGPRDDPHVRHHRHAQGRLARQPEALDPAVSLLSKIPLQGRAETHIAAPLFHSWGFAHFTLGLLLGSTLRAAAQVRPRGAAGR